MIKHCPGCHPHAFQDRIYGLFMRIMNPIKVTTNAPPQYRCTICLTIH